MLNEIIYDKAQSTFIKEADAVSMIGMAKNFVTNPTVRNMAGKALNVTKNIIKNPTVKSIGTDILKNTATNVATDFTKNVANKAFNSLSNSATKSFTGATGNMGMTTPKGFGVNQMNY